MGTKPVGEFLLFDAALGDAQHQCDDIGFRCFDTVTVQSQEHVHDLEGDTLVAIDEGTIASQSVAVAAGGRDTSQIHSRFVTPPVAGTLEG